MKEFDVYFGQLVQMTLNYAPKLILALVVLSIGWWVIGKITVIVLKAFDKPGVDTPEMKSFLGSIVGIGLKVLLLISVAGIIGIETTSFVGVIAAMGFAVGLALQGNLSNFAAGVLILLMRPFKIGDEVKLLGNWFFVKEIQIFHTIFRNFDNTETIIPNSQITSNPIQNLSANSTRSISVGFNIPYSENLKDVKDTLIKAGLNVPEVDSSVPPFFWVKAFEDHYVNISIAFRAPLKGYWDTDVKVKEALVESLKEANIDIAYPIGITFGKHGEKV